MRRYVILPLLVLLMFVAISYSSDGTLWAEDMTNTDNAVIKTEGESVPAQAEGDSAEDSWDYLWEDEVSLDGWC